MIYIAFVPFTLMVIYYNNHLNKLGYYKLLKSPFDYFLIKLATWLFIISIILASVEMTFVIYKYGFAKTETVNLLDMIIVFSAILQLLMTWGYTAGVRSTVRVIIQCYPETKYLRNVLRSVAETLAEESSQSATTVMWVNTTLCVIVGVLSNV